MPLNGPSLRSSGPLFSRRHRARPEAAQGRKGLPRRRAAHHALRRGEDLQEPQGQGGPRGVPEDLLGAPRPRPRRPRRTSTRTNTRWPRRWPTGTQDPGRDGSSTDCGRAHPARQARRGEEGADGARPRALASPRPGPTRDKAQPAHPGGKASITFDSECRAAPGVGGPAEPHRGEPHPPVRTSTTAWQGRQADQARRPPAEAQPGPDPPQGAAPGLPSGAPSLCSSRWQDGGTRGARPRARRRRRPAR